MGLRTKNHLIEDESRQAFKNVLPKMWVCRDKNEDYGIDCEVEIFDNLGNPTGLVFWVQLKGTAAKEKNIIQSFSFKNEKLEQFKSYGIPVLIVRYSTSSRKLYIKWAKSLANLNRKQNSTRIYFLDNDEWNNESAAYIFNYLKKQIEIQRLQRFPIKTVIKPRQSNFKDNFLYSNVLLIKNYIASMPSYFEITPDEKESTLQIYIEKKRILFSFTDLSFSSLGLDYKYLCTDLDNNTFNYIQSNLSIGLFNLGKHDLGSKVFFENDLFSLVIKTPKYFMNFLPHLLTGTTFTVTLNLIIKHLEEKEIQNDNSLELMIAPFLLIQKSLCDEEQHQLIERFFQLNLLRAEKRNDNFEIATANYSLGNFYRGSNNLDNALALYSKAKRYDSTYKSRAYFNHEIGGILFLLGRFNFAAAFYRKALNQDNRSYLVKGLLADCLLFGGEYQSAANLFEEFLTEESDNIKNLDEWHLKYTCLNILLANNFPKKQNRNTSKAQLFAEEGKNIAALAADMLYPLAWFNKGISELNGSTHSDAYISFLMAALICTNDIESWTNATLIGFNTQIDISLLICTIRTAYLNNGQIYLNKIYEALSEVPDHTKEKMIELIDKVIPKKTKEPLTLRIFENESNYESLDLSK